MTSWHNYAKAYAIGHGAIQEIFHDRVVVEEKIDGSQFSFGLIGGELKFRSKGKIQDPEHPDKMFQLAIDQVKSVAHLLTPEVTYRCEYLQSVQHNTIKYDRTPKLNLIVFDIEYGHESFMTTGGKRLEAERLGLECVPVLYEGRVESAESLKSHLEQQSVLGGSKVEGIVVKNYARFCKDGHAMMGKFVSEAFKEQHALSWGGRMPTSKTIAHTLGDSYNCEARWHKAVQHLRDRGELTQSPKDIGKLLKELQTDLLEECGDEIKKKLLDWAWHTIAKCASRGFPQWYKEQLLQSSFTNVTPFIQLKSEERVDGNVG